MPTLTDRATMTEEVTMGDSSQGADAQTDDPGAKAVRKAADDEQRLSQGEERSALDYLLGAPEAAFYSTTVKYDTPEGLKDLRFHFKALDGRRLDKIEQSNVSQATGLMDKAQADAALVAEATTSIEDPATGHKTDIRSERFRTIKEGDPPLASTIDALHVRFGTQIGLIAGVAGAIREAAGWRGDRVGKAARELVDASGN
jgi:hypothetical protein